MALLLKPIFVELGNEQSDQQSDSDLANSHIAQKMFSPETSENSLYSMWKVATKVKSVMADGERFENLTWRAWHRKNQLEKVERERREQEQELRVAQEASLLRSQATAIPRLVTKPSTTYSQGYSSILLEIQKASARAREQSPAMTDRHSLTNSSQTASTIATSTSTNTDAVVTSIESSESTTSNSSVKTNKIDSTRRRKKNVDKFIKRQQVHLLEKISEQTEETRSALIEETEKNVIKLPKETPTRQSTVENSSISSTNDTISVGSIGEVSHRKTAEIESCPLFRRHDQPARKHASPPHSDRPHVSMLTMLLSKSNTDNKRPESCPPPIFGASPPSRPGAPVPHGHVETPFSRPDTCNHAETSPSASLGSQDHMPSPIPANTSPNRQTIQSTTPDERLLSSEESSNTRRRGLPNPKDYTTPLYIW